MFSGVTLLSISHPPLQLPFPDDFTLSFVTVLLSFFRDIVSVFSPLLDFINESVCYCTSDNTIEEEAALSDEKVVRLNGGRIGASLGLIGFPESFLNVLKLVLCLICSLSSKYWGVI